MNRVFVISAPHGKNLEPAKEFGPLTVMLDGNETSIQADDRLQEYLDDFKDSDFLLLIGNPMHIAIATHYLGRTFPCKDIQILLWDRESQTYTKSKIYALE